MLTQPSEISSYVAGLVDLFSSIRDMPKKDRGKTSVQNSRRHLEDALIAFIESSRPSDDDAIWLLSQAFRTGSTRVFRFALQALKTSPGHLSITTKDLETLVAKADLDFLFLALEHLDLSNLLVMITRRAVNLGEPELIDRLRDPTRPERRCSQIDWFLDVKTEKLAKRPDFVGELLAHQAQSDQSMLDFALVMSIRNGQGIKAILLHLAGARLGDRTDVTKKHLEIWQGLNQHHLLKVIGASGSPAGFLQDPAALGRAASIFK